MEPDLCPQAGQLTLIARRARDEIDKVRRSHAHEAHYQAVLAEAALDLDSRIENALG